MRSEKPICSLPRLSEVSPTLPLKQFQFKSSSDWRCPFLILSKKSIERFLFPRLSPPGDRWCHALRCVLEGTSQAPQHFRSSQTQTTCDDCLFRQSALPARSCPFNLACPEQYTYRRFRRWMSHTDTSSMGFPFHFRPFVARLYSKRWLSTQISLIPSFMICQIVTSSDRYLRWNIAHILCCLINLNSVPFNLSCILILVQNVGSHLCFKLEEENYLILYVIMYTEMSRTRGLNARRTPAILKTAKIWNKNDC